jgi:predicted DNA-binding protein (UPF0251 family)/predicted Fe-Mo cluster-binding NifX family protein
MSRPRRCRQVAGVPKTAYFKPQGILLRDLAEVNLAVEGLEAIRLADLEGLTMEAAAAGMGVSRHTFGRILAEGRKAVAEALVNGAALRIEGGHYELQPAVRSAAIKELNKGLVAVSSEGPSLDDRMDPRFGRARGFVIVDVVTMSSRYLDNGSSQAVGHGAGVQTARRIAEAGAGVLLTGVAGPKALQALSTAGITVVQDLEGMTVREAVQRFKAGTVDASDIPTV